MPTDRDDGRQQPPSVLLTGRAAEESRRRVEGEIRALKATCAARSPGLAIADGRAHFGLPCDAT